ncbi:hypothetical protein [Bacillus xiapuensis]|uniref:hypothetical protein n=1 Tax=Bacillus xiapuensis TaxID=2014075 RepID=UPI000C232801|nr:hypothetical protein [Bacillus xiapuensis]
MKKRTMSYVMSGALSISILGSAHTYVAAEGPAAESTKTEASSMKYKERLQIKKIRDFSDIIGEQAKALGISQQGKDFETVAKEVRETKMKLRAQTYGINTANKDFRLLAEEVRQAEQQIQTKQ